MNDVKKSEPERTRQSRSFGSFLLFLFVLVIVLVVFGGGSVNKPDELTQDEYLFALYAGRVESQEFQIETDHASSIEGSYRKSRGAEPRRFTTRFSDIGDREDLLRELKARAYVDVSPLELETAVDGGYYRPLEVVAVSTLRAFEPATTGPAKGEPRPMDGSADDRETRDDSVGSESGSDDGVVERGGASADRHIDRADHLYVHVLARSSSEWTGAGDAPFPLRSASGSLWLAVDGRRLDDLAALENTLSGAGAAIERHTFDLTGGTSAAKISNMWGNFAILFLPWLVIFAVLFFFMRQLRGQGGAGGVMNFGRSRAQMYTKENRTNVTFDDIAGAAEAKSEVREIVEFLKNPGKFQRIGGRIPRGVLLNGPPGCGKTLLAKAIAGEAEVPFFSISGSDFVEMFVGVGASRVRDLFKQARDNSPCIIFLDEIDAVGRRRGSGMGGGHDEREQTLNAILVEMDGFGTDEGIIVVAATNRPDVLDPALLRPGRFDREVTIDLPDKDDRRAILEVHLRRVRTDDNVDAEVLARSTPSYSGAELAAIINEAAIMAVLAKRDAITMDDLEEARDKVRYGRQKESRKIAEEDLEITAYHEAGHAVLAALLPETDPPHKVTIIPRGQALGVTMVLPEKESYHTQRRRLLSRLAMMFGGRIAEQEFCGDISAGAYDDIRRATDLARAMVTEYGMSDTIGPINYAERQGSDFLGTEIGRQVFHSEETSQAIDREVRRILEDAYAQAEVVIRANRAPLEECARALLKYETITGDDVRRMVAGESHTTLRPDAPTPPPAPSGPPAGEPQRRAVETDDGGLDELPGTPGLSPA
jgi:ATP-dependent metalloprotease FtsH